MRRLSGLRTLAAACVLAAVVFVPTLRAQRARARVRVTDIDVRQIETPILNLRTHPRSKSERLWLQILVSYECDGRIYDTMPSSARCLERCKPIYEEMPGWMCSTSNITKYEDLPVEAKNYVSRLVDLIGGELGVLSVGPARHSTLRIAL